MKVITIKTDILLENGDLCLVGKNKVEVKEIANDLAAFQTEIGCDTIDITRIEVGGKFFDIIVDDDGLCKGNAVITVRHQFLPEDVSFVGNVIICQTDGKGNEKGLTDEEISLIKSHVDDNGVLIME